MQIKLLDGNKNEFRSHRIIAIFSIAFDENKVLTSVISVCLSNHKFYIFHITLIGFEYMI
jgi:hypothetical protein